MMVQDGLRWLQDGKIKLPRAFRAWQNWHPVEARRRFSAKCILLHRCLPDGPKVAPKCPQLNPRWGHYGSKMAQERLKMASKGVFSCPRGVIEFDCPQCLGRWPRGWHKIGPRWPQMASKWRQGGPRWRHDKMSSKEDGKIKLPHAFEAWQKWHPVEAATLPA